MSGPQIKDVNPEDKVAEIHAVITANGDFLWTVPDDEITARGLIDLLHNRFEEKLRQKKQARHAEGLIKEVKFGGFVPDPRLNGG